MRFKVKFKFAQVHADGSLNKMATRTAERYALWEIVLIYDNFVFKTLLRAKYSWLHIIIFVSFIFV